MLKKILQFIKFGIVGVMNTLVDFIVFTLICTIFAVDKDSGSLIVTVINLIAYSCGVANSYFFNTRWTFKGERNENRKKELILFIVINIISYVVNNMVLLLCKSIPAISGIELFGIEQFGFYVCKLIATAVGIIVNFAGNKLFVFKTTDKIEK